MRSIRLGLVSGPVLLATAVALSACGGTSGSTGAATGTSVNARQAHDAADVAFTQTMIRHNRQTLTLSAQMAPTLAYTKQVKTLASTIAAAQQPQIDKMITWLHGWGAQVPSVDGAPPDTSNADAGGDTSGMPENQSNDNGMLNSEQVVELGMSHGRPWDEMFLQLMVTHDTGAIQAAHYELTHGRNAAAQALARDIIDVQGAQVAQMRHMLAA